MGVQVAVPGGSTFHADCSKPGYAVTTADQKHRG